jgi:rod shape determining protein RodA
MFLFGTRTYYLISAIIGAYGWLAGLGVAFVSCMIGVLMLRRAMIIPHTYGRLLAVGIGAYFLIRFLLNLLVNMNVIAGSFNLPFISHGRIEYIADTVLMGVYLSVWRRSTFMKDDVKKPLPIKKQAIMVE